MDWKRVGTHPVLQFGYQNGRRAGKAVTTEEIITDMKECDNVKKHLVYP